MNEEELKNIEGPYSWIAKDLEDMQYFAGGQIITDVKRLVTEVRRLNQVRREALLEAAKVNCGYCRHGDKPVFKVSWHHADSNGVPFGGCTSNRIYDLLAVDTDERATGQGQGEGKL